MGGETGELEWTDYDLKSTSPGGRGSVLTIERNLQRGKRSGVGVDMQTLFVMDVRNGKVVRWQGFASKEEALEAAGLSE